MRTLITDDARLTIYAGANQGELFDLSRDPMEMNNCYGQADFTTLESIMMPQLAHTMVAHCSIERVA